MKFIAWFLVCWILCCGVTWKGKHYEIEGDLNDGPYIQVTPDKRK